MRQTSPALYRSSVVAPVVSAIRNANSTGAAPRRLLALLDAELQRHAVERPDGADAVLEVALEGEVQRLGAVGEETDHRRRGTDLDGVEDLHHAPRARLGLLFLERALQHAVELAG